LWGIQPEKPGFEVVSIKPKMSTLKNSSIKMPTIRGEIKGEYMQINNRLIQYIIELPANMTGNFIAGNSSKDVVTVNGETVNLSLGTIRLNPGMNKIEIKKNSF
jgi:hypothetical protein